MTATTLLAEPARRAPAARGPDPDAAEFRALAAALRDEVEDHIRHVFEWLDRSLETGESRGEVATVLALADLDDGKPLSYVAADLLRSADLWMPCPGEDDPSCSCGLCAYGRSGAVLAVGERVIVRRLTGGNRTK